MLRRLACLFDIAQVSVELLFPRPTPNTSVSRKVAYNQEGAYVHCVTIEYYLFLRDILRFDFLRLRGFAAAVISRRRAAAHPSLFTCWPRARPNASGGTFFVITEPAPTYAPLPTRTGATSAVSLPVRTVQPAPMRVLPRNCTQDSMRESAPTTTSGSISTVSGNSIVTPASMMAARLRRRNTASTAARSARVLHPRTSSGSAARTACTFSPFCRKTAMASVE